MRRPLVAGNWKMYGDLEKVQALANAIKSRITGSEKAEVAVFPPFVYIPLVSSLLKGSAVNFGSQNVATHLEGAYTGEVSPKMLLDFHCKYAIIGHSERRQFYGETDEVVALKFQKALEVGLTPIVCVGETLEERKAQQTENIIKDQLNAILNLDQGPKLLQNAILAYEPIWAIGTGVAATPDQAQEVHQFIRSYITNRNTDLNRVRILYGGSVKAANAVELFAMPDIDGGLVGGASLNADEFVEICLCFN